MEGSSEAMCVPSAPVLNVTLARLQKTSAALLLMLFIEHENAIQQKLQRRLIYPLQQQSLFTLCISFSSSVSFQRNFEQTLTPHPFYSNRRLFGFHIHKEI